MPDKGLGRIHAEDWRDLEHLTRPRAVPERASKFWGAPRTPSDQKSDPHCVAHAWRHFIICEPQWWTGVQRAELPSTRLIYDEAQKVDEWPGPPPAYGGTSVRAGAKVLQRKGLISEYVWAVTLEDTVNHLLQRGPLVVGTDWYSGMTQLDRGGFARPRGTYQGGHAYVLIGWDHVRLAFLALNSWGSNWGRRGRFWIQEDDFDTLLNARGEACSAIESEREDEELPV